MPREKVITTGPGGDDPKKQDAALRPKLLKEVIGQKKVAERLAVAVRGSKTLKEPLGHILFDGPPGLGKTTFATVLPNELGTSIQLTSGLLVFCVALVLLDLKRVAVADYLPSLICAPLLAIWML